MSTIEIQSKVNDLRELRRMADELQAEIDAIQDAIKEHMTAANTDELTGADYKITWKTVTSSRIDTAALKRELPSVVERFSKTTITRRFVLV